MHALHRQQLAFAAALAGSPAELATMATPGARISTAAASTVYRNNVCEGFRKALALIFPVVEQLVAVDYFRQLAADFQRRHPSRSGNLNDIGATFSDFLRRRFSATEFAYLSDVAKLEWACQEVTYAAAPDAITLRALSAIDPDRYPELRLSVHPAVRFVSSPYPIALIWLSNQPDAPAQTIDLGAGGDHLLVTRNPGGMLLHRLTPSCLQLGVALQAGASLGDAVDAAGLAGTPCELGTALHKLFTLEAFDSLQEY